MPTSQARSTRALGERVGIAIARRALEEPLRQIVTNAGLEASVVVKKVFEGSGSYGFNAETEAYGDLEEMGILDPTKVVRLALQNAASVAGLMMTTTCMVAEKLKTNRQPAVTAGMEEIEDY